eukprot:gnl/TRDRNA2_/TRDRNA2_83982_c0_seq2.p1 gnl/TRDRNA2_/TRDRNA2_83982_c0~~gnl/TRDRNA2_/TRDRNA2_83982_c0_seq2.p1  ORF type:complete len:859 (+),score=296.61 gnl/TRDRNA2_/TRDRNA2_83982_c0_seq2:153-2729(+)
MGDEKDGDGDFEASAFEALERDFQEILQELVGDKSLEHFRTEYEKLHRALKKSHESEKHLIKKCRELNAEIVSNAVKVQTALKLSQEDQATITALKKEIERAWKMVETSHEKEQRAKDTIHNLKTEISKLGRLVEQGAGLSINQENMVNNLIQEKNDLIKHRDMLQGQVAQLATQNTDLHTKVAKLDAERLAENSELMNLREQLDQRVSEAEKQQQRKEKLDKELKDLRGQMEVRQNEIQAKQEEFKHNEEDIAKLEAAIKAEKATIENLNARHERLDQDKQDYAKKRLEEAGEREKLASTKRDLDQQLMLRQNEIDGLKKGKARILKMYEGLKKKKAQGDAETQQLESQRNALKAEINNLTKELESLKKQANLDSKQIVDLLHERDILNKNAIKADERTKKQIDLVRRHEGQANTLAKDVQRWKIELQLKKGRLHELDKQREKYASELSIAKGRYEDSCEELKARDLTLAQLKKNIADVKAKLGQQKNLYEAVRTDKNLYSKNLVESLEEIAEMKKKFKVMYHQIEQLKEEIKEKDKALITEHFEHQFISKESEKTNDNLKKHNNQQKRLQQVVDLQQQEIKKLEATIQEAEVERQNQRKEFEGVISERNILGTQLIRRNEELALLYEKIKIQHRTLQGGEISYKQRLEESRTLKIKEIGMKRELRIAKNQVSNIDELKKEVYQLQRELLRERTKVKALSEELENPMNVHRWRKLEGSDPATYEMIQKVKTLQKRLISKTEEAVEKDLAIQEKEKLYLEMRNLLSKQPGPEVAEEVAKQQNGLKEKTKQMKAMAAELNMYHAQLNDYKDEIERLTKELQDTKRRYFEQRRREQLLKDTSRTEKGPNSTTGAAVAARG